MSKEQSCNTCCHCNKAKRQELDKGLLHRYECDKKGWTPSVRRDSIYDDHDYECYESEAQDKFVTNIANRYLVAIEYEHDGEKKVFFSHTVDKCVGEFSKYGGYSTERVFRAYYKGERINDITVHGLYRYQTLGDVIGALQKRSWFAERDMKKEPERKPISKVGQLPGQLDLWDVLN